MYSGQSAVPLPFGDRAVYYCHMHTSANIIENATANDVAFIIICRAFKLSTTSAKLDVTSMNDVIHLRISISVLPRTLYVIS